MFSPTSKQASCVARLAQVMQYLIFFSLAVDTNGLRVIRNFVMDFHFVELPISATVIESATMATEMRNPLLLSFLSVIIW
jgi:hypothetical protein